jgi:outer membrane protein OmpA-like peptidoglycan-associated protein
MNTLVMGPRNRGVRLQFASLWTAVRAALLLAALSLGFTFGISAPAQAQSPQLTQFIEALTTMDTDTMARLVYEIPDADRMAAYAALSGELAAPGKVDKARINTLGDFLGEHGMRLAYSLADAQAMAANDTKTTGSIEGLVMDDVSLDPLAGVTVSAGGVTTTTQADGGFKLEGLAPRVYSVTLALDGKYQTKTAQQSVVIGMRNAMMLTLKPVAEPARQVATGTITGRITYERDGKAAVGIQVILKSSNNALDLLNPNSTVKLTTDGNGRFRADDFPAGKLLFMVQSPGGLLLPIAEEITLDADQTLDIARALQTPVPKAPDPVVVISGVVRDALSGETLSGVQVAANFDRSARSDATGTFRVAGVKPGQVAVVASLPGYQDARIDLGDLSAGMHKVDVKLRSATVGALVVQVVDGRDGTPLVGATIAIAGAQARTDGDGKVARMNVAVGQTSVTASADRFKTGEALADVVAGERRALVLRLDPITDGRVLGRVIDAETGAPVAGAVVSLGGFSATSAADGSFAWDAVPQGQGRVDAQQARYHPGGAGVLVQAARDNRVQISLQPITTGALVVTVRDSETGQPLADVRLSAGTVSAASGADGVARFDPVEAGPITISAARQRYHGASQDVRVQRLETATATLRLDPITVGTITGRVLSRADKTAIAGANVRLGGRVVQTGADGAFRLQDVQAGQVALKADATMFEPASAGVTLARTATAKVTILLQPITYGTVNGVVLDAASGQPIAGAAVNLADAALTSDGGGRFGLAKVDAGKVRVAASATGYTPGATTAGLKAGDTIQVTVTLEPITIGTITGIITDAATGRPVAGAQVLAGGQMVETDAQGRFSLSEIPAGAVSVEVRDADYGNASGTGQLGRGGTLDMAIALSARSEDVAALRRALDQGGVVDLYGIRFDSGKDQFKPSSLPTLRAMLELMQNAPGQRFTVEGHTDSDGSDGYNQALSERRAATVVKWLADRGIKHARLDARGMGEGSPVASNDTVSGKALNRRVVLRRTP